MGRSVKTRQGETRAVEPPLPEQKFEASVGTSFLISRPELTLVVSVHQKRNGDQDVLEILRIIEAVRAQDNVHGVKGQEPRVELTPCDPNDLDISHEVICLASLPAILQALGQVSRVAQCHVTSGSGCDDARQGCTGSDFQHVFRTCFVAVVPHILREHRCTRPHVLPVARVHDFRYGCARSFTGHVIHKQEVAVDPFLDDSFHCGINQPHTLNQCSIPTSESKKSKKRALTNKPSTLNTKFDVHTSERCANENTQGTVLFK